MNCEPGYQLPQIYHQLLFPGQLPNHHVTKASS